VALPLRKIINRLSQTGLDELRTRLSQEFTKRRDYALYRSRLLSEAEVFPASDCDLPRFFFEPDELAKRVALIKEQLPAAAEDTVLEADNILQHRFDLLGYRDLDYGAEIDWHLDAVHGKRAPLKPWYKIRFLDFEAVGDHKVTWELNRHQHLVTLAKAWAFTGNVQYTQEVVRQFYSWQKANLYPLGINWGSSLEVAFRSLSWLWIRNLLGQALGVPESFDQDLLRSLARNGRYIETFLSTYFSPNTHLIGEAVALFFIGMLCPEIPLSKRWRDQGLNIVLTEAERQVRPDGVYFEQSLYYHVYALDFFLHCRALAACNRIHVPESFDAVLRKMLEVVRVLAISGPLEGFGDDDGGRVFNPRRNRVEHMSDPLALGAGLFQNPNFCEPASITEEAIWLLGEQAIQVASPVRTSAKSAAFIDGGLYVMTSDRGTMLIDAGPHGAGSGGHGHADALSVRLSMNGQRRLVDPGSYVYVTPSSESGARDEFRGTRAHNTLRVDGQEQAVPRSPFAWNSLPHVNTEQWIAAPQFDFFAGRHDGYTRLSDPVVHRRMIFHLHGEYWLVRDVVEGKAVHDLEISWHFATDLSLSTSQEKARISSVSGDSMVMLGAGTTAWELAPEEGYVSPAYGERHKAPLCVFRNRTQLPTEYATLLLTHRGLQPLKKFQVSESEQCAAYSYGAGDLLVFGKADAHWDYQSFNSDSTLLFSRCENSELELLIAVGASFIEWNGQPVFRSNKPCSWLQWNKMGGATASDATLLKFFDPSVLSSRTAVTFKQ
jgi:Heparinase II/III-like protein/Heparinase II/III N-terminus